MFGGKLDELDIPGVAWHLGENPEDLVSGMDAVIVSPGVPLTNPVFRAAEEAGVEVMGELEYAFRESTGLLLAVTGTNGKTTTCTLLGEIFKNAGKRTSVVGNIGEPYTGAVPGMRAGDVTVCEVSSFQLETVKEFRPRVSAILNITEDHLVRHHTMENYAAMKERIFQNAGEGDFVVLNYEDAWTKNMTPPEAAKLVWFSSRNPVPYGAYVRDGYIVFGTPDSLMTVCRADEVYIPGRHNLENALAATAMALCAGVPAPIVRHTLKTFRGVEHRIEYVQDVSGVRFVNDSKGTNPDSTVQAIRAMKQDTVIILGGSNKDSDYYPMCCEMKDSFVKKAVLIGETAPQIKRDLDKAGFSDYEECGSDFEAAVRRAFELAGEGGCVLLSPACASFDMFEDYEARGRIFKEIVRKMGEEAR